MDSVRAMCKAKDRVLHDLEKRCRAAETHCKVLENQGQNEQICRLEIENAELRARLDILYLENRNLLGRIAEDTSKFGNVIMFWDTEKLCSLRHELICSLSGAASS
jgi:hypothetical protein